MLTIFSFLLLLIGGVNWLLIGLLQYDFVAGIFGYQGSIFSRIIYIIIGLGCLIFLFKVIKGKGTVNIFSRRNKKDLEQNIAKMKGEQQVEAAHDNAEPNHEKHEEGLINEHLRKDD